MAGRKEEVIDSQLIGENVGFLDKCFENTFDFQSSILIIKEFSEEQQTQSISKSKAVLERASKKHNASSQNKTLSLQNHSVLNVELTQNPVLNKNLKDWGLPPEIAKKYEQRGVAEMFDWQVTCLGNPKVLMDCCNLVYSAPTSAGKTLVAEILTIKTILERQKKVIIILPFVSIVREKMFYLQDILCTSGIRVEGFMGAQSPPGGLQAVHVAICTIEKANSLVNRLLDDGNISDLGAVIVDELHLLGDPHRGYILELLLTKIKYVSSKLDEVQIQIVGMSATLPNLEVLARWLEAELFITQFRPIPLDEFCMVGNKIYNKGGKFVSTVDGETAADDSDNVLKICLNTIKEGCSVLIFCMTKNRCENLAQGVATSFYKLGCSGSPTGVVLRNQLNCERISEVLEQLKSCPVGLDQVLKNTVSFGVAYHHAGLTFDERDIIEGGFKSGAIRVLVATSTLSSGVNLPARKVIIRTPVFQRQPINILTYKQMVGRAGRMGKDTKGESILVCTESEKKIGFDLMMGALDPVKSCIECEDKYMRAVLEMIASQVACSREELELYSRCTLLFTQKNVTASRNSLLENTLDELKNFELVREQTDEEGIKYVATPLGKACLSSSMAPNDGLSLFCELQKARQCLVLETDLHLIYLVTPYSVSSQWSDIDWLHLLTLWESLTKSMKKVGELVGIQESFIIRCLRGTNKINNVQNKLNVHKRFYTALALQDLVNEVPLYEVAAKFQCARGFLQSLQQAAATFAGMVTAFCRQLGWKNMEMLISQFQDRLHFGIHSELLELMKLPSLNGTRARTLFEAGFETLSSIASGDARSIENALLKSVPFQSEKEREGDDSSDIRKRNKMKNIWITGCCGMTAREAAGNLILEARKYLEHELGVADIKWNSESSSGNYNNVNIRKDVIKEEQNSSHRNSQVSVLSLKNDKDKTLLRKSENSSSILPQNINSTYNQVTDDLYLSANDCKSPVKTKDQRDIILGNPNLHEKYNDLPVVAENDIDLVSKNENEIKSELSQEKYNRTKAVGNSPSILKDDIIWDTINFTGVAFDEITKKHISDKIFSPNISFGDSVDKTKVPVYAATSNMSSKCISVKDISLFSSDGDNSSLFEESLPVDMIPSKILFDKTSSNLTDMKKTETGTDFMSINSNTILNAFKTTVIESDPDEDIKLVYEDDNKASENELNYKLSGGELDLNLSKDVEVMNTQNCHHTSVNSNFISPLKRHAESKENDRLLPTAKKTKKSGDPILQTNKRKLIEVKLKSLTSKTFVINIQNQKINCFLLRETDILETLHAIEYVDDISMYLYVQKSELIANTEIIGSNIIKPTRTLKDSKENDSTHCVKGISLCINSEQCFYLDLVSVKENMSKIKSTLNHWFQRKTIKLKTLHLKADYVQMKKSLGVELPSICLDVSIAEWLIDSEERIPNIVYLVKKYCKIDLSTIPLNTNGREKKYKSLNSSEHACLNVWAVSKVADMQSKHLLDQYRSVRNIIDIETQVIKILADSEYYGLTVDKDLTSKLLIDVKNSQEILQKRAYKTCGYHFNFNSSKDVAKVVLGLYRGHKVSTKKSVLTSHNSLIASIVIFWRKLNSILTKTLYPLTEKACIYSEGNRISPSYTMFTCTGRISMHEPNLQNVPRTFSIPATYLTETDSNDVIEFNCRNIFRAAPGHALVSADYCQLEMRVLTHYSEDEVLTSIMRSDADVFRSIAASWGAVEEDQVDDDLRQKAKQLCYGILYGMGNRTLSQNLDVTEAEASVFMETFYRTYPAIQVFTRSVIEECRKKGYVETLMKRRRYLPDVNSSLVSKKGTAERQAVNTTIQGSAADIAKAAMCAIDNKTYIDMDKPKLILQMHDELIYEVRESHKLRFAKILKNAMEGTVTLNVPLPVKVRSGYTWGSLEEIKI